jgi:hypothetical protein
MLSEIYEGRRAKQPLEIYWPGDLPIYTPRHFSEICVAFGTVYCACNRYCTVCNSYLYIKRYQGVL